MAELTDEMKRGGVRHHCRHPLGRHFKAADERWYCLVEGRTDAGVIGLPFKCFCVDFEAA